jgi:pilus assembly protein CpaE
LDSSDVVAVLATPDVPSLKNLGVFLDTLKRLKIPDEHLKLVLNKTDSDIGLDVSDIQKAFGNRFVGTIPQSKLASRALNLGTVAIEINPKAPVSRRIVYTLRHVLPDHLATAAALPKGGGRLSAFLRFFRREGPKVEDVADITGGMHEVV